MQAITKIKQLIGILERNLQTRSNDILPILKEVLKELEDKEKSKYDIVEEEIKRDIDEGTIYSEETKKLAREYLKEKKVKGYGLLKGDNVVTKAIENGFRNGQRKLSPPLKKYPAFIDTMFAEIQMNSNYNLSDKDELNIKEVLIHYYYNNIDPNKTMENNK